jgi:hypothetical protein
MNNVVYVIRTQAAVLALFTSAIATRNLAADPSGSSGGRLAYTLHFTLLPPACVTRTRSCDLRWVRRRHYSLRCRQQRRVLQTWRASSHLYVCKPICTCVYAYKRLECACACAYAGACVYLHERARLCVRVRVR